MSITPKYPASEAQHNPYAYGYNNAADHATAVARIAGFGAIRRAVACARYHDYLMTEQSKLFGDGDRVAMRHFAQAAAIRSAIRAAIGSEKA